MPLKNQSAILFLNNRSDRYSRRIAWENWASLPRVAWRVMDGWPPGRIERRQHHRHRIVDAQSIRFALAEMGDTDKLHLLHVRVHAPTLQYHHLLPCNHPKPWMATLWRGAPVSRHEIGCVAWNCSVGKVTVKDTEFFLNRGSTNTHPRKSRQSCSHITAESRRLSVSTRSLLPWNMIGYSV